MTGIAYNKDTKNKRKEVINMMTEIILTFGKYRIGILGNRISFKKV